MSNGIHDSQGSTDCLRVSRASGNGVTKSGGLGSLQGSKPSKKEFKDVNRDNRSESEKFSGLYSFRVWGIIFPEY